MKSIMRNESGVTIMELLIAALITGIVSAAGFQFYANVHNQSLAQQDISDLQLAARSSLQEISRTLRMSGYKIPEGHPPYKVSGDSLYIYYSDTKPVDTVLYYITPNATLSANAPTGWKPYYLMKKVNNKSAEIYNDVIRSIKYTKIDTATFQIAVETQSSKADMEWQHDFGYRSFTANDRITIRNLNL